MSEAKGTDSQPAIGVLLRMAVRRLSDDRQNHVWFPLEEVENLCERLEALPGRTHATLGRVTLPFRPALQRIIDTPNAPSGDRDMMTLARYLDCVYEQLARPDVARVDVENLRLDYARCNLGSFLIALSRPFHELAVTRKIAFEVSIAHPVVGTVDIRKLEYAVLNLLFNAYKHTPRDGQIRLRMWQRPCGEVCVTVTDSGPGIPLAHRNLVFDRIRQQDRSVVSAKELGFNLGVSWEAIRLQGGCLSLTSSTDGGCEFRVRLPGQPPFGIEVADREEMQPDERVYRVVDIATAELDAEDHIPTDTVSGEGPMVLVAEDCRSMHRLLVECLQQDYTVASALDGETALDRVRGLRPDLLITDITMPGMDGESLIRAIRRDPQLSHVAILALSSGDDPQQTVGLLASGAQDVLRKPFSVPELRARVAGLVNSKRATDILNHTIGKHETDLIRLADEVLGHQRKTEQNLEEVALARELAESASQVKSNFLRMVSHELKTPITAMQLHLHNIERTNRSVRFGPARDAWSGVWRSSQRLLSLIDTALEWARVESGRCKVRIDDTDVDQVIDGVVVKLSPHAEAKGVRLLFDKSANGAHVATDARVVGLVTENLLIHALQNTDLGEVRVRIDGDEGEVRIWVTDGAPPIPSHQRQEIFAPMKNSDDIRWRAGSGSGLGLYVVRDIARAIRGDMTLHSSDPSGNTYLLRVPPLPRTTAIATSTPPRLNPALRQPQTPAAPGVRIAEQSDGGNSLCIHPPPLPTR